MNSISPAGRANMSRFRRSWAGETIGTLFAPPTRRTAMSDPTPPAWSAKAATNSGDPPESCDFVLNMPEPTGDYESAGDAVTTLPPAAAPMQIPGYEILGVLGRGGMGVV